MKIKWDNACKALSQQLAQDHNKCYCCCCGCYCYYKWKDLWFLAIASKVLMSSEINKFFLKGHIINILGFAGHPFSVATIQQLDHCSLKAALDNTWMNRYDGVPIKFYLQQHAAGQIWPVSQCAYPLDLYDCICYLLVISIHYIYLHGQYQMLSE